MKSTVTQENTHRRTRSKRVEPSRSALALGIRAMLVAGGLLGAPAAWADCTTVNDVVTCDSSSPNPYLQNVIVTDPVRTVIVLQGAILNVENVYAIHLGSSEVTVVIDGEVNKSGPGNGHGTVHMDSAGTITVGRTGKITATVGSDPNQPAITIGEDSGSVVIRNEGLIDSGGDAIRFFGTATAHTTIDNFGTIVAAAGEGRAVNPSDSTSDIVFRNHDGGVVDGDVLFTPGNNFAYLYTGSLLTGDLAGGDGTDTLVLAGTGSHVLSNAVGGAITGFESLRKEDTGTWTLDGVFTDVLPITVAAGTLRVDGDNSGLTGELAVENGATFGGAGTFGGNLVNRGMVTMVDGTASTLSVLGTYIADGGELHLEAMLDDGSVPQADVFQVGAAELRGGPTGIVVHSLGGSGASTVGDGIPLVQVADPAQSDPGAFTLSQRVVSGAHEYLLFHGGVADPADGNWYLRSEAAAPEGGPPGPLWRPEIGGYIGNRVAATNTLTHQLYDRPRSADPWRSIWVRVAGENLQAQALDGRIDARGGRSLFQIGSDILQLGDVHLGGMLGYSRSEVDVDVVGNPAHARAETEGAIFGAYATWFAHGPEGLGAYLDTWAQAGQFDNTVRGDTLLPEEYDADAWAVSGEFGYAIPLNPRWAVEPQAQVVFSKYDSDDVRERNGTQVAWEDENDTLTRVGVRLRDHGEAGVVRPYFQLDWWHGAGTPVLDMGPTELQGGVPKDRYEATAGLQAQLGPRTSLAMRIQGEWGKHDYKGVEGQLALQTRW